MSCMWCIVSRLHDPRSSEGAVNTADDDVPLEVVHSDPCVGGGACARLRVGSGHSQRSSRRRRCSAPANAAINVSWLTLSPAKIIVHEARRKFARPSVWPSCTRRNARLFASNRCVGS